MAKTFGGNRPWKEIRKAVQANNWEHSQAKYEDGSDYVTFNFHHDGLRFTVVYSTFNGRFMTTHHDFNKGQMITEESTNMDGTPWYDALLNFIYLPAKKQTKKAA